MVTRGKRIVNEIKDIDKKIYAYQMDISKMAIAVCNIRHGGISRDIYTIKNYAADIGLPYKTVQNWVAVYRNVVVKLDKEVRTKKEWSDARVTNDVLKEERRNINKEDGKSNTRHAWKKHVPNKKVQRIYNNISENVNAFMRDFLRSSGSAKHILYLINNNDLSLINDRELLALMETLDKTSDIINEHLTEKQKTA